MSLKSMMILPLALVLVASSLFMEAPSASAKARSRNFRPAIRQDTARFHEFNQRTNRYTYRHVRVTHRPRVIFRTNCNFLRSYGYNYQRCPSMLYPRHFFLYDRDDIRNQIYLRNWLTGPGSYNVNRVNIGVSHDFFMRLRHDSNIVNINNININTGNNSVVFNTIVGDISTGDVNISIN